MALKIAIIGGGSAYAPGIISAFIQQSSNFSGAEIALMDIDPEALAIVHALSVRMVQSKGVDLNISATTSQAQAVSGATYILSTFRQGGFEARHLDEAIPTRFGIIGQETIGPGGFFFAMRTLPVIKSLLSDIKTSAPGAVLINYTNPTQIVAEAVTHFSDVPCISICDQTRADEESIRHALEMPEAEIVLNSIGLNHATWSTTFTIDGEDGISVMRRNLKKVLAREDIDARTKRQFQLADYYSRLPNSYLQYYYYRDETLTEARSKPKTRAEVIMENLPGYYQHFKEQIKANTPQLEHVRGGSIFGDMAVQVLSSLIQDDGRIITLNIKNQGSLPNFSPERVVEVPAHLSGAEAIPLPQERLPQEVTGLLSMLSSYQWLAAQAIWRGNRKDLVQALATNPLVLSISTANDLLAQAFLELTPYFPQDLDAPWAENLQRKK
jgi:6-phospho-beta-glucosidase